MYKSKYAILMQNLMNEHDLFLLDSEQQEIEKWVDKDLEAISELNKLLIRGVSQQRELLTFLDWVGKNTPSYSVQKPKQIVQAYLKANCG